MKPASPIVRRRCSTLLAALEAANNERGVALLFTLMVAAVVMALGAAAMLNTMSEMRTSDNFRKDVRAMYLAESGLDLVLGLQNDLTRSPRYLKNTSSYSSRTATGATLRDTTAVWSDAPGGPVTLGTLRREVRGKDPVLTPPPYTIRSTAVLADGNEAIIQADVDLISLKDYALFGESSVAVGSNITLTGRVYSAGNLDLRNQTNIHFMREVEAVGSVLGASNATYDRGYEQGVPPYPPLTALVDLNFFRNASQNANVCGTGTGLYIGADVPSVASQSANLFGMGTAYPTRDGKNPLTGRLSTCNGGLTSCYQIDLGLFDFTSNPISYGGRPLQAVGGGSLTPDNFNGVIYVNGQVHVWGILGGRSAEDRTVADDDGMPGGAPLYNHPQGGGAPFVDSALLAANGGNFYSNDMLDAGEDANANGTLDPALRGRPINIVVPATRDIVIDHNIFMGTDTTGTRVSLGLIAGNKVYVDEAAPRTTIVEAAVIAMSTASGAWTVEGAVASGGGLSITHPDNFWAKNGGDLDPGTSYQYDLNQNGALEANNGDGGTAVDSQELSMLLSAVFRFNGSLVVGGSPNTAAYTAGTPDRPRSYRYDSDLINNEIPCYPTLPRYGVVAGTFAEINR
jgi:hypothetical protein